MEKKKKRKNLVGSSEKKARKAGKQKDSRNAYTIKRNGEINPI